MTLENAKVLLLTTIDEVNAKKDITSKLNMLFSMGQQEIAQYYPVYKSAQYTAGEAMALPADFYKASFVQKQSGAYIDFEIKNNELVCDNKENVKLTYESKVADIPFDATDPYELQTQNEAIMALIFYVAAQLYNNEESMATFQSYFAQYQGKLQNLVQQPSVAPAVVIVGDSYV